MTGEASFTSKLEQGRQRFLAHVIEHAFAVGRRTPADFIRHFPPQTIMEVLADRKDLRADILVPTTGLKPRIAIKKSWQSAADDVQSALDEGETDAQTLVSAFHPDDRVRYLDAAKLWSFLVEGSFWTSTGKGQSVTVARQHVAYMIDRALVDKLVTPRDVVDAISIAQLASHLPRGDLAKIIGAALDSGRSKSSFTDVELLAALPPSVIVEHVPLAHVFESILQLKVAALHDYLPKAKGAVPEPPPPAAAVADSSTPTAPPSKGRRSTKPPPRSSKRPPGPGQEGAETEDSEWVDIPESVR
jgi:hypothetical protein